MKCVREAADDLKTRNLVGAILASGDKLLMMHRSPHRALAPGLWSSIGGHIEPAEMGDPMTACLREIRKESGISPTAIENLALRYLIVQRGEDEVTLFHYFTGRVTEQVALPACDEGTLHWVDAHKAMDLPMSLPIAQLYRHFLADRGDGVDLCGIGLDNSVTWSRL